MDVDPDQVDQRARPDRPVRAEEHRAVDVLGRDARLVDHAHAVVQERDEDAVDDETRACRCSAIGSLPSRCAKS